MEDEPSSPLDFDWDAIDAELDGEEGGNHAGSDSRPDLTADSTFQHPDQASQREEQETDTNEGRSGYFSDEERPAPSRPGSMSIFKDVVKDTVEHAVPGRQRIFPSEPAKKLASSADVEKFSLLRIKDRTASSAEVNTALSDLRFVRLEAIKTAMMCDKVTGSWATIGVIVERGLQQTSKNGKNYLIWKLGTLENTPLSLFLFGAAYTEHWKESLGAIVAIFNANVRPDLKSKDPSLTVFRRDQVMKLGTSVDYRVCSGKRKDGTPCTIVLNKQLQGQFCQYHASAARQEFRSNRPELTGGKLALVGPGIRRGYPPKPVLSPMKDEVFKGHLKHVSPSDLKDLLSDTEKMPLKSYSQGKRFLEVMAERNSGTNATPNKGVKRQNPQDPQETTTTRKRTPLAEKQMNTKRPGSKHVPHKSALKGKSKLNGADMEIDTLDDLNDSMVCGDWDICTLLQKFVKTAMSKISTVMAGA
ncbi:unnamed protein product [Calypogeia fissa]